MTQPSLIIIAGTRESGKTTLRKKIQDVDDFVYCTDDKLNSLLQDKNLNKDDIYRKIMPEHTKELRNNMKVAASEGKNVIVEILGLSTKGRSIYKDMECFKDYSKEVWFILPPQNDEEKKELTERISKRKGKSAYTEAGMKEHLNMVAVPNLDEGYDIVKYFNLFGEVVDYNSNIYSSPNS